MTASREDRKIFIQEERRLLYMHTCMPSNVAEMPIQIQKDLKPTFILFERLKSIFDKTSDAMDKK